MLAATPFHAADAAISIIFAIIFINISICHAAFIHFIIFSPTFSPLIFAAADIFIIFDILADFSDFAYCRAAAMAAMMILSFFLHFAAY
jgi:hypothetical protein